MSWQDTIVDRVGKVSTRTQNRGPAGPWVGILLRIHPDIHAGISRAAKARGISMATWTRRIIVMGLAKELGTGYAVWMDRMPTPVDYGDSSQGGKLHSRTGRGHESLDSAYGMCTHPGCDDIHM